MKGFHAEVPLSQGREICLVGNMDKEVAFFDAAWEGSECFRSEDVSWPTMVCIISRNTILIP